jgi:hypothetical protein
MLTICVPSRGQGRRPHAINYWSRWAGYCQGERQAYPIDNIAKIVNCLTAPSLPVCAHLEFDGTRASMIMSPASEISI